MKDYSHGMKNKMQMLINIIAQPNILLLDEPLTSLDVVVAEEMKQLAAFAQGGAHHHFFHPYYGSGAGSCATKSCCSATASWRLWKRSDLGQQRTSRSKIIAALREDEHE